jgi:hypothetical protein
MRVEAYSEPSRGLYCSEILYGSERIFRITTSFGDLVSMTVWDGRTIARIKYSVLDFGSDGNIAYVDEITDVESLQRRVTAAIDYAVETLHVVPDRPADVLEMLGESRAYFEGRDYERKPELDKDARFQLMRPWYASIVQRNLRGVPAVTPERTLVQPAMVAGVEISEQLNERGFGPLMLARGSVCITYQSLGGKSDLKIEREGQEVLSLDVTEDPEFPAATAHFGGEEQEVLDEVRAMARDMLAVPLEDWPEFVWRDDLLSALKGVDDGRFYATSGPKAYWITARLMAEGDDITCSLSQNKLLKQTSVGSLDVLLHANGFEAYDQRSGSLLEVAGDDVRLTQRKIEAAKGEAFDAATFAALVGMLRDYEDEVPEELRQSLDVLVAFAVNPQIPQASPVDILEAPNWSAEHRQKVTEALKPLRKVTIGS